jgi:hypothetical protein
MQKNLDIYVMLFVAIIYTIILLITMPSDKTLVSLIKDGVMNIPVIMPYDTKKNIADKTENFLVLATEQTNNVPAAITKVIVNNVSSDTLKNAVTQIPDEAIQENKCKRIIIGKQMPEKEKKDTYDVQNLPWDQMPNKLTCNSQFESIDKIDLNNVTLDNKPAERIIIY